MNSRASNRTAAHSKATREAHFVGYPSRFGSKALHGSARKRMTSQRSTSHGTSKQRGQVGVPIYPGRFGLIASRRSAQHGKGKQHIARHGTARQRKARQSNAVSSFRELIRSL